MLKDVEVHKKIFRRYVRQIEKTGGVEKKVNWWEIGHSLFVRSGWLYFLPSPNERPDLYAHLELREISEKINRNDVVIRWVGALFLGCVAVVFFLR